MRKPNTKIRKTTLCLATGALYFATIVCLRAQADSTTKKSFWQQSAGGLVERLLSEKKDGVPDVSGARAIDAKNKFSAPAGQKNEETPQYGRISGLFHADAQNYFKDPAIGAPEVPERLRVNAFANLNYSYKKFGAGVRLEDYRNPLLGFPARYVGGGLANRFVSYNSERLSVTLGHFYDQFGSGLIFRSYWEPFLGFDSAIDGLHVKGVPVRGLTLKGVFGRQRDYFQAAPGMTRGADLELDLPTLFDSLWRSGVGLSFGGSFVSRYQKDDDPIFILPENVAAFAGRMRLNAGAFSIYGEYAYKINDPNETNRFIYRPGQALYLAASWAKKGLGLTAAVKRSDNMDFRADRSAFGFDMLSVFSPPLARQHTYRMPSLYLYFTRPNGEMAGQFDLNYRLKKDTKLGGPYGASFTFNVSAITDIENRPAEIPELGYESDFFALGERLLYFDVNAAYQRKWNKKWKSNIELLFIRYDKEWLSEQRDPKLVNLTEKGIFVGCVVADVTWQIKKKTALRMEAEYMYLDKNQDFGSWMMLLAELTVSPNWFFTVTDEWNYGNAEPSRRLHYFGGTVGYTKGGIRITAGYGRQRAGMLCIGGVCRPIPAANGFNASLSVAF